MIFYFDFVLVTFYLDLCRNPEQYTKEPWFAPFLQRDSAAARGNGFYAYELGPFRTEPPPPMEPPLPLYTPPLPAYEAKPASSTAAEEADLETGDSTTHKDVRPSS